MAQSAVCMSNQRQTGIAYQAYASDYKGAIVPGVAPNTNSIAMSINGAASTNWTRAGSIREASDNGVLDVTWIGLLEDGGYVTAPKPVDAPTVDIEYAGSPRPYSQPLGMFRDPANKIVPLAHRDDSGATGSGPGDMGYHYNANWTFMAWGGATSPDGNVWENDPDYWPAISKSPTATPFQRDLRDPGRTMLVRCNGWTSTSKAAADTRSATTWNLTEPGTEGWHNGAFNLVFADGHVISEQSDDWTSRSNAINTVKAWQSSGWGEMPYPYGPGE